MEKRTRLDQNKNYEIVVIAPEDVAGLVFGNIVPRESYIKIILNVFAVCWEKSKHAKCLLCGCDLSVWFSEPNGLCMPWGFVPLDIEHNGGKLIAGGICNRCCNGKKFNEIYNSVVDYLTKNLVSSGGDIVVKRLHMPCDTVQ